MPQVIAFEDARTKQFRRKSLITPYLKLSGNTLTPLPKWSGDTPDLVAYLVQSDPGKVFAPHFHIVDQFQVIAEGKGKFGRHDIAPYCVHFSRAYTPYGPIVGDSKTGISFFVLRTRADPRANFLPESSDQLKKVPDRQPWQITRQIKFPAGGAAAGSRAINLQEVLDIKDDQGLSTYSLTMAPNTKTTAPDPSHSDGQYLIVVKGGLRYDRKDHKAFSVVFVEPEEEPFPLHAGVDGLEAIIVNFPLTKVRPAVKSAPSAALGFKKWQCELCAFAYDEAIGLPEDGIAPGTRWEDVPESWTCPGCGTAKSDFRMVEA
jgi:rubredoxin